jgi:hypothetical protein
VGFSTCGRARRRGSAGVHLHRHVLPDTDARTRSLLQHLLLEGGHLGVRVYSSVSVSVSRSSRRSLERSTSTRRRARALNLQIAESAAIFCALKGLSRCPAPWWWGIRTATLISSGPAGHAQVATGQVLQHPSTQSQLSAPDLPLGPRSTSGRGEWGSRSSLLRSAIDGSPFTRQAIDDSRRVL